MPEQVAIAGVLDQRPFENAAERAWIFRTVGRSHDASFWGPFVRELQAVGYDDVLSIENEDILQPPAEGVAEAAAFMAAIHKAG